MNPKKSLKQLRIEARELKLPGRSKYRRKAELEKAIEEFKRPIPAPRKKKQRPIPASQVIMNLPVPRIEVPILEPVKRPLRPPRAKKKLEESAENVIGWMDWLKKSGESFVNKASKTWQKMKNL